ncbi:hypothetical protein AKJ37_03535 [candidate division MSBL1 archaeon SCGC-AAA259I09]|uniref:Uncharacterized protein n=1 Tax=candidate division MSBL1 archaeon SCGC-AAA259I09 TaxID=1698267 RepID=A0A133USJ9_9EURY|nr:hypothetical protein AKJ37_03535 [candidate division MSBL1 archaeon SCGC-AAA259I09]
MSRRDHGKKRFVLRSHGGNIGRGETDIIPRGNGRSDQAHRQEARSGEQNWELIKDFIAHTSTGSEESLFVVLHSGYQVHFDSDFDALIDHLTQAIVGESVVSARSKEPQHWSEFLKEYMEEERDEMKHIVRSTHEDALRLLFWILLKNEVSKKREAVLEGTLAEAKGR